MEIWLISVLAVFGIFFVRYQLSLPGSNKTSKKQDWPVGNIQVNTYN